MEKPDHESALLKLAEAVSDGRPVDGDSGQGSPEHNSRELTPVKVLERVAAGYRSTAHLRQTSESVFREARVREDGSKATSWKRSTSGGWKPRLVQPRNVGWILAGAALAAALFLLGRWMAQ